jgi:hypothetical protein
MHFYGVIADGIIAVRWLRDLLSRTSAPGT